MHKNTLKKKKKNEPTQHDFSGFLLFLRRFSLHQYRHRQHGGDGSKTVFSAMASFVQGSLVAWDM